tara:strand:+ start:20798 stop:21895 length:1098 start_codon:yes stop_codon:yes gene_type:complete
MTDFEKFKMSDNHFWKNKRVLITGHTGFKGSWLTLWLNYLGSSICGFSKDDDNDGFNLFNLLNISSKIEHHVDDISNSRKLSKIVEGFKPNIIFHLAAQPLVRKSYKEPFLTWSTNVMGTLNILEATRNLRNKCVIIIITSDKVYKNKNWLYGYREEDELGGHDPYSSSKAACELLTNSWRLSYCGEKHNQKQNLFVATARAGNVIGGGDWAEDRIIPDLIKSLLGQNELLIRNPKATRPWQHVLDPLSGYLTLAEKLFNSDNDLHTKSYNFGPPKTSNKSVEDLISHAIKYLPNKVKVNYSKSDLYEASLLNLNIDLAHHELGWKPKWDFNKSVYRTINWYKLFFYDKNDAKELCLSDIKEFLK